MESNTGSVINLSSLYSRFQELEDKRKAKGKRYTLATVRMGVFLAKLCGEDKPSGIAEWVRLRIRSKRRYQCNNQQAVTVSDSHEKILAG